MTQPGLNLTVTPENVDLVCKFLRDIFPQAGQPTAAPTTKEQSAPVSTPAPTQQAEVPVIPPSFSDIRERALLLSKAGKQETLKALFQKHGAAKLSEIAPDAFPALFTDLGAALNG